MLPGDRKLTAPPLARILVVDDERSQMQALCDTLREQGYEAVGVSAPRAALAAVREAKFELLLADLMMPEMNGIALLQAALQIDADLVGIIMTGEGTIASAVKAMQAGALDYVLKPFKVSIVLPVLARALTMRRLRLENAGLQQRLRARAADLEVANQQLEAFSYSVSHDLRAPLRAIDGYCRMIEEDFGGKLDEEALRLFGVVRENSRKMGTLIDDLLAFSMLGRQPMSARLLDMTSLASQAWADVRAGLLGAVPEFRLPPLPPAWGDRALLRQVWANLLSNAAKYSSKNDRARIEVAADPRDAEVVYCVRDNGAGFDMRYAEKLFGVFQRLHSDAEFSGTGVGLAIVHQVVTRHGGRVWAQGEVGRGAEFFFSLPVGAPTRQEG